MLTEVKKQLNQNLRSLHLPTIRQCYEEQGKLAGEQLLDLRALPP